MIYLPRLYYTPRDLQGGYNNLTVCRSIRKCDSLMLLHEISRNVEWNKLCRCVCYQESTVPLTFLQFGSFALRLFVIYWVKSLQLRTVFSGPLQPLHKISNTVYRILNLYVNVHITGIFRFNYFFANFCTSEFRILLLLTKVHMCIFAKAFGVVTFGEFWPFI